MAHRFRNKLGDPVDPVPFLVVSLLGLMAVFSFGPIYLTELGMVLEPAIAICTVLVVTTGIVSYRRYVWTARPDLRAEIPAVYRLQRLCYGVALGVAIGGLLFLPLLIV